MNKKCVRLAVSRSHVQTATYERGVTFGRYIHNTNREAITRLNVPQALTKTSSGLWSTRRRYHTSIRTVQQTHPRICKYTPVLAIKHSKHRYRPPPNHTKFCATNSYKLYQFHPIPSPPSRNTCLSPLTRQQP